MFAAMWLTVIVGWATVISSVEHSAVASVEPSGAGRAIAIDADNGACRKLLAAGWQLHVRCRPN